jgi:phycoerythrobilin:ferredoxin oxidoreductase
MLASELVALTHATLDEMPNVHSLPIPPWWAEMHGMLGQNRAIIRSWAWETPELGWLRLSYLNANPQLKIISIVGFPRLEFDLPLFGAEVMVVKEKVTFLALDWMPLAENAPYLVALAAVRRAYNHFPLITDLPQWVKEIFSPHALFSRPLDLITKAEIVRAFASYFESYLTFCEEAPSSANRMRALSAQRRFCTLYLARNPGRSMLVKIFGERWTEGYTHGFLFHPGGLRTSTDRLDH